MHAVTILIPICKKMEYTELILNSKGAPYESAVTPPYGYNYWTCTLPTTVEVHEMKVLSAHIPHVWYNIRTDHDVVAWTDADGAHSINIPEGNYDDTLLCDTVASMMTADAPTQTYTCTISSLTGKCTITNTTPANFTLTVTATSVPCINLGFDSATTYTGAATYTAAGVATIDPETSVGIILSNADMGISPVISTYNTDTSVYPYHSDGLLLAVADVTADFGSYIRYEPKVPLNIILGTPLTGDILISFTNADGERWDLQGSAWTIKLGIRYKTI